MKKYLISFGDDHYVNQKLFFKQKATASGFFDDIKIFSPKDISAAFIDKVGSIIQSKKGAGFWIWKPFFIKQVLDRISHNDILMYCDVGCFINRSGEKRYHQYLEMLNDSDTGTVDFELPFREYEFTKQEIFNHFESPEVLINANQLMATVLLVRKCEYTSMLVNYWYNTAINYPSLFTDEITLVQHQAYVAARHDQSVFSVIRKQFGANKIADETYFNDFGKDGIQYPFWAKRLKG
jgi:hypothetical protein